MKAQIYLFNIHVNMVKIDFHVSIILIHECTLASPEAQNVLLQTRFGVPLRDLQYTINNKNLKISFIRSLF